MTELKISDKAVFYDMDYAHDEPMFAYCTKPVNGQVKQLTEFEGCREELADTLFEDKIPLTSTTRLRYIVCIITNELTKEPAQASKKATAGVRLLNIMEKRHKWPLTKIYKIKTLPYTREVGLYGETSRLTAYRRIIVGSNRWIISPHMLSLFVLIFRLPYDNAKFITIENYENLAKTCKAESRRSRANFSDSVHLRTTFDFWDPIMLDYRYLFRTIKENFEPNRYNNSYYGEGIRKLCCARSNNDNLNSRFRVVAAKAGLKIPTRYYQ